jgi:hypothetical protein
LRRGPSPLDRRRRVRGAAAVTSQAKPKRSHACVANPLRVDRGRPYQNQGKPIRERAGSSPEAWLPKCTPFVRAGSLLFWLTARTTVILLSGVNESCLPYTGRLLRETVLSIRRIQGRTRCMRLGVKPDPSTCEASSDRVSNCIRSRVRAASRQGWQPARGKTRLRGFSAAHSPARRATPNSPLGGFRERIGTMNCEQHIVFG